MTIRQPTGAGEERLRGTISSFGVPSGDRFVVGSWDRSPLGSFTDVMWARADGHRTLLASSPAALDYVSGIYEFDESAVVEFSRTSTSRSLDVQAGPLAASVTAGGGVPLPFARPWWVTRWIERPIARFLMGVETWGVSPLGVEEWYQSRGWRWISDGIVTLDGVDLGPIGEVRPPLGVGFSEPPARPSIVQVAVRIRR